MSKTLAVVLLLVMVAGSLTAAILLYGIGAFLPPLFLGVALVAGFVTLAMNAGQYESATGAVGKSIDGIAGRIRAFVRRACPPE